MADLINGLGGGAGFGTNSFERNDDGFTPAISLTGIFGANGVQFGDSDYTEFFINNNGMITFAQGIGTFTPNGLSQGVNPGGGNYVPAIALFWTDIDTEYGNVPPSPGGNSAGTNLVYWHEDVANDRFIITWDDTSEYEAENYPVVAGQIILTDAGNGNMDIEFRYEYADIDRATAAGWNVGTGSGIAGQDYYEIPLSGGTNHSDLDTRAGNTGQPGIWRWYLRDGVVKDTAGTVNFSVNTLVEAGSNDGSFPSTILITLDGDEFTGQNGDDLVVAGNVSVTNVPAGLTASVTRTSDTTAQLTLVGTAASHDNADDISNLTVSFGNTAFVGSNAEIISGAIGTQLNVDFSEPGNQAPDSLGNLTLANIDEDTLDPAGATVSSLAGLVFKDADPGSTLAGIAVQGNTADAVTEGSWQYSSDGGANWHDVGAVSETQALALSASTLLRFVPGTHYFGSPEHLVVRALDDSASFFTKSGSSESRVTIDASLNGGSSPIAGNTNTIQTTIDPVNDAPVISGSGTVKYQEGDPAVATGFSPTLSDVDNATLASATVSISNNFQSGADLLAFVNDDAAAYGNIAGSFNASSGVLSLTSAGASATLSQWQQALSAVTYRNSSDNPSTAARTLSFTVNDGALGSNTTTSTVTIGAVNDQPVISDLGSTTSGYIGEAVGLDSNRALTIVDEDSADFDGGLLTITLSSGTADGDFVLDGKTAGAGANIAAADAKIEAGEQLFVEGTAIGTVDATSHGQQGANLHVAFNANATPALASSLLENMSYRSDTAGQRIFDIAISDGDGVGTGTASVTMSLTPPDSGERIEGVPAQTSTITTDDNRTLQVLDLNPVPQNRPGYPANSDADIALYYGDAGMELPATRASLPPGVGLISTGMRVPTTNEEALANLIFLINQTAGTTENNKDLMLGGGQAFLEELSQSAERGLLIINSIKLRSTSAFTDPTRPIKITGTADVIDAPLVEPGVPVEALVIDTRDLPAGSVIELENIEFAVIVGDNVTVRGGNGNNVAFAGAGSQNIVLGEGDDELHGGDGDDVIGSLGGNDRLFGDAGNDTVVGGPGDDELQGGEGDDILVGGLSDAGDWQFALSDAGFIVGRFTPQLPALAPFDEETVVTLDTNAAASPAPGSIDTRLAFAEYEHAQLADIALLYHAATGELPGTRDLSALAALNSDTAGLAQRAATYMELDATSSDGRAARLDALQQQILGEQNEELTQQGMAHLEQGGSWADIVLALSRHELHRASLVDEDGNLLLAGVTTLAEAGWAGGAGNDSLHGGEGNDLLIGGGGNNVLDGGAGIDMVSFFGTIRDYEIGLARQPQGEPDVLMRHIQSGDVSTLRGIEMGRIGDEVYRLREDNPLPAEGIFLPAADMVELIGRAELAAQGLPESWQV